MNFKYVFYKFCAINFEKGGSILAKTKQQKEIDKIIKLTKKNMQAIGVYREEFDPTITAYAQLKWQHDTLNKKFIEEGKPVVEEYTNKNGSTNLRKTAEYMVIEVLRKDVLTYENTLGLTPAGLKKLNKTLGMKKKSSLGEALKNIEKDCL